MARTKAKAEAVGAAKRADSPRVEIELELDKLSLNNKLDVPVEKPTW